MTGWDGMLQILFRVLWWRDVAEYRFSKCLINRLSVLSCSGQTVFHADISQMRREKYLQTLSVLRQFPCKYCLSSFMLCFFQGGKGLQLESIPALQGWQCSSTELSRVLTREPLPFAALNIFYTKTTPLLLPAPSYLLCVPSSPCILHGPATGTGKAWYTLLTWENTAHTSQDLRARRKRKFRKCSAHLLSKASCIMPSILDNPCPRLRISPATPQLTASATTSRTESKKSTKPLKNKD